MKKPFFLLALLISLVQTACFLSNDEEPEPLPACIADKVEAFKTETSALTILEVNTPDGKQYHFQHSCLDCGDDVFDANCTFICVTNVDGYEPGMVPCEQSFFESSRTEIWSE